MSSPLQNMMDKIALPPKAHYVLARMQQEIIGLAQDFWKDGHWEKPGLGEDNDEGGDASAATFGALDAASSTQAGKEIDEASLWNALPGEISEKMWGTLCVTPGDAHITDQLIQPLGITKDMSLLDLSAGLGGRVRKTANEYGIYVDGLEPDPDIAARARELFKAATRNKHVTINHYDPMSLAMARSYDCIVAREAIYRATDKGDFIKSIAACCKMRAQISFTDYVIDPEFAEQPGIVAWKAFEQGANPLSLIEMAEIWAKNGFTLRVHDDQSDYYKQEVRKGLERFAKFLASEAHPSAETKRAINKRILTWAHRMAALEAGMKFYRFYGLR